MATQMTPEALLEYVKTLAFNDSGGGGDTPTPETISYNDITDKPSIEGVSLVGNKTFPQLNLDVLSNTEIQDIFNNLI